MAFDILGTIGTITTIIITIVVTGTIGVIAFWLYQMSKYNIIVVIREVIKGRTYIHTDKARRIKDKKNNYWWKLLKEKVKLPEPPSESVEVTGKGKKFAEFFKYKDSGYFPSKATAGYTNINVSFDEEEFKKKSEEGFEPLTTQERALYVHEILEAEKYKKASTSELIAKAIPYIALVMIMTVLLLFGGEFFKPLMEHNEKMIETQGIIQDKMTQTIDKLDAVINDRQSFVPANRTGVPD